MIVREVIFTFHFPNEKCIQFEISKPEIRGQLGERLVPDLLGLLRSGKSQGSSSLSQSQVREFVSGKSQGISSVVPIDAFFFYRLAN